MDKNKIETKTVQFIEKLKADKVPPINSLTAAGARELLRKTQAMPLNHPHLLIDDHICRAHPEQHIALKIVRPILMQEALPTIFFVHGAGWVMGGFDTHFRLICDLVEQTHCAVVYVDYALSPEAIYPTALDELYSVLCYVSENSQKFNLHPSKIIICGDSVGGNMSAVLTLLAKERLGPKISAQILLYPVTSAEMNTKSYEEFAQGPWLTKDAMQWFWNAYLPNQLQREHYTVSPLNSSLDQLKGLPPTLILTAENDVLRDEGEAFAHKLMQAEVDVEACRILGSIHDFMMLNALATTSSYRLGILTVTAFVKRVLKLS